MKNPQHATSSPKACGMKRDGHIRNNPGHKMATGDMQGDGGEVLGKVKIKMLNQKANLRTTQKIALDGPVGHTTHQGV